MIHWGIDVSQFNKMAVCVSVNGIQDPIHCDAIYNLDSDASMQPVNIVHCNTNQDSPFKYMHLNLVEIKKFTQRMKMLCVFKHKNKIKNHVYNQGHIYWSVFLCIDRDKII